jgi:hypothetical protein
MARDAARQNHVRHARNRAKEVWAAMDPERQASKRPKDLADIALLLEVRRPAACRPKVAVQAYSAAIRVLGIVPLRAGMPYFYIPRHLWHM